MYFVATLIRNGRSLFLIAPTYGRFMLSDDCGQSPWPIATYLFDNEASARAALFPFVLPSDVVEIKRTYGMAYGFVQTMPN